MAAGLFFLAWTLSLQLAATAERSTAMNVRYNSSRRYLIIDQSTPHDFISCCAKGYSSSYRVSLILDRTKLRGDVTTIGPLKNTNPDFYFKSPAANCSNGISFNFSISNVKESHEGSYYCEVHLPVVFSSKHAISSRPTFVPVYSEPILTSFQQVPANGQVIAECRISFQCKAKQNDYHPQDITSHGNIFSYTIAKADPIDDGHYVCVIGVKPDCEFPLVDDILDSISAGSPIDVLEPEDPVITKFSSSPHPNASGVVLLLEGSAVSLECAASGRECYRLKPTLTNIEIFFNSRALRQATNSANVSYSLESVKADSSSGSYTCKASLASQPSQPASKTLTIVVIRPVKITNFSVSYANSSTDNKSCYSAGKRIKIFCSADGAPQPQVTINDSSGPSMLGANKASVVFAGNKAETIKVTCVAKNDYNTTSQTIDVCFYEPATITTFGLYSSLSRCVPAGLGRPFLHCSAAGSPMTSLRIFNESNTEVGAKESKKDCNFYMNNPDPSLSGNYSCKATGSYNTAVKYFELIVYEPVAISHFEISPSGKCVSLGSAITILCSATGIPVPSVEIVTAQGDVIASSLNGTVEVSFTANKSSSDRYTCRAQTPCSRKSQSSVLRVLGSTSIIYFKPLYQANGTCECAEKNSAVNITCEAIGCPFPVVRITGSDGQLSPEKENTVEWRVTANSPGTYTCNASSELGSQISSSFDLCVSEPLKTESKSLPCINSGVVKGACTWKGLPLPTVQILDPYSHVLAEGNGTIALPQSFHANLTSIGNYTCKAYNHCYSKNFSITTCTSSKKKVGTTSKKLIYGLSFGLSAAVIFVGCCCCKRNPRCAKYNPRCKCCNSRFCNNRCIVCCARCCCHA